MNTNLQVIEGHAQSFEQLCPHWDTRSITSGHQCSKTLDIDAISEQLSRQLADLVTLVKRPLGLSIGQWDSLFGITGAP